MNQETQKELIEELYDFREFLREILNKKILEELVALADLIDKSYVDAYHRISEQSEYGKDCGYAKKAQDLFNKFQKQPIKKQIERLYNLTQEVK